MLECSLLYIIFVIIVSRTGIRKDEEFSSGSSLIQKLDTALHSWKITDEPF